MNPTPEPDENLVVALRSGKEEAFVALYGRRRGAIYRFSLHMTGSATLAEDITQEVFLTLIRDRCGYDPQRGTLAGYLFGVARKLVLRHLSRTRALGDAEAKDRKTLANFGACADPMVDLMRQEGIEELRRAVLALPKRYREVVVLCDLEEVDYLEAARLLNCPIGTVRSRLHRARALLLEKLRHRIEPPSRLKVLDPARSLI
jgi:RNA polymerase sigma-70 factor (ECF subfamily)